MKFLIINIAIMVIMSFASGYIGGSVALKKFERNHSTLTIYQPDADFIFNETQSKILGE